MNHLVFVDTQAGELEKILSGVKRMLVKELDPEQPAGAMVKPGDGLYFLRDNEECTARVRATVLSVLPWQGSPDEQISHILKELQPKLQLTEDQYNHWSAQKQALFVEFAAAQKIEGFSISYEKITQRTRWIDFDEIREVTERSKPWIQET